MKTDIAQAEGDDGRCPHCGACRHCGAVPATPEAQPYWHVMPPYVITPPYQPYIQPPIIWGTYTSDGTAVTTADYTTTLRSA